MDLNLMVIDNFLPDPDAVRNLALKSVFDWRGSYPGVRALCHDTGYKSFLDEKFEELYGTKLVHSGASTQFQICTEVENDNWIHHDTHDIAGVLYLTPDAPLDYGTSIFRHKESKILYGKEKTTENNRNEDEWEEIIRVNNIYNRLIIYNGWMWHRSNNFGFGNTLENSRLTQVFFMNFKEQE